MNTYNFPNKNTCKKIYNKPLGSDNLERQRANRCAETFDYYRIYTKMC